MNEEEKIEEKNEKEKRNRVYIVHDVQRAR